MVSSVTPRVDEKGLTPIDLAKGEKIVSLLRSNGAETGDEIEDSIAGIGRPLIPDFIK